MTQEELLFKFEELASEYNFKPETVNKWYELLKSYPCFNELSGMDCLEILCQKRQSSNFDTEYGDPEHRDLIYGQNLKECIEYSLYYVYQEEAVPYITSEGILTERDQITERDRYYGPSREESCIAHKSVGIRWH